MSSSMMETVSQQIKATFLEESQFYINELQRQILELDPSLANFRQQISQLLITHKSLRVSAIKADFYTQTSTFLAMLDNFEQVIIQLRDRSFNINQITKELMIEAINMISQIINDYCLDLKQNLDLVGLQNQLFDQIYKSLDVVSDQLKDLEINNGNDDNYDNDDLEEPFNLDNTPEALHLFDIEDLSMDFDESFIDDFNANFDSSPLPHDPYQTNLDQLDNANSFLLIQLKEPQEDRQSNLVKEEFPQSNLELPKGFNNKVATLFPSLFDDLESDFDEQLDYLINPNDQQSQVSIPELLTDILTNIPAESLFGNDDETELQGVNWNHGEDDLDNPWNKFASMQPWLEPSSTENELDLDHNEVSSLENINPSLNVSNIGRVNNIIVNDSNSEISNNTILENSLESLTENDNLFWNSLESIEPNQSIDSLDSIDLSKNLDLDFEIEPQLDESLIGIFAHLEAAEQGIDSPQELLIQQDFPASDIDTAIEESPIYQKKRNNLHDDVTSINFDIQNFDIQNFNSTDIDLENDLLITTSSSKDLNVNLNSDENLDLDFGASKQLDYHDLSSDTTIRIPVNYLEMWEDLSEEVLMRKGNLDIYLSEIRLLARDAHKNLQLLNSSSNDHKQGAIASLESKLEHLTNVIDITEQQTQAMSRDVRILRKNFRQIMKYPISSLVRKFPRILRELSLQNDKQVELIVQGSEIGVERSLSAIVTEALELLIRNAFEYSIESTDKRQKAGKNLQGKIEIFASQNDDSTIITLCDDGCGFDDLSNNFSSNSNNILYLENISRLSEVRKKLADVGGIISVKPEIGKGNQITLILPNKISLLRVLLFDISEMCLAIPSKAVLEVIPIKSSHAFSDDSQENLLWRDRQIPIVRLNSLLKLNCQHHAHRSFGVESQLPNLIGQSEEYKPVSAVPSFLIIQNNHHVFALQTNGCWHEQEATFHQVEGDISLPQIFLGAVILGNNQAIALINPSEIVEHCLQSHPHISAINTQNHPQNQSSPNLDNLNSLSDFFRQGDIEQEYDISGFFEQPVRSLGSLSEPENLESSSIFMSDNVNAQKMRVRQSKVLIVESSANVRRYLAMTLARSGFLTEQVQDGREAIAFLKERLRDKLDIDLVITDLEMPQMDGFKLLSGLRADPSLHNLPIVVLTSRNNENDQKLALELGANAYFSKPYREQELVKTLQDLISK